MAGHSQFKNIMYRKGAQDKKRAKVFTKIIRELTTAARSGLPDPAANPRLRAAMLPYWIVSHGHAEHFRP